MISYRNSFTLHNRLYLWQVLSQIVQNEKSIKRHLLKWLMRLLGKLKGLDFLMSTRLERLVVLVSSGSTATIRNTSSKQLSLIIKQYPQELYPLLHLLYPFIYSSSYDTRLSLSFCLHAISCIIQFNPLNLQYTEYATENPAKDSAVDKDQKMVDLLLDFNQFDLINVLEKGSQLLSSAGKEFDSEIVESDPHKRLLLQKSLLKERLGLASSFVELDLVAEDVPVPIKSEVVEDPFAGLSARERNQLKRKLKQAEKNRSHSQSSTVKKAKYEGGTAIYAFDLIENTLLIKSK
jgi:TATA-binding protein-associated factor